MTALKQYAKLQSTGLWRASDTAQRQDVVVSFGDATLVIADKNGRALSHWSLPAIERLNPGKSPAHYAPDTEGTEQLEIEDPDLIAAIDKITKAIARHRPRPGRLRWLSLGGSITVVLAVLLLWLPGALQRHTLKVVPDVKRDEIGAALLEKIDRIAGMPCGSPDGSDALDTLKTRLSIENQILIYPAGLPETVHLPGKAILIPAKVFEDHEDPAVAAGFILAQLIRTETRDPLRDLLEYGGILTTFRLLTTADIPDQTLLAYAETLLSTPPRPVDDNALLTAFAKAGVSSGPYAYALDPSGETTLALIEADPFIGRTPSPILSDGEWISLQSICGG
ncbi:hypothetical protein [Pseudaestuariivita rosea]|uniref:hypothetical protein n=1 Tax=Pseudaestuariivita rosea TaxID=2763263 RepID=UPI001ABB2218|nr:hypothetical protein [Pseudaestuariivita rosea]